MTMGLLSAVLGLPFAPLRGTVWLAEQIAAEAERRMDEPALLEQRLQEVTAARASGALAAEDADRLERDLVARLLQHGAAVRSRDGGAR